MTLQEFKKWTLEQIALYPNLKTEIIDFYRLAIDEIEEGGSQIHEIDLAINSIKELSSEI